MLTPVVMESSIRRVLMNPRSIDSNNIDLVVRCGSVPARARPPL